jgi:ketosteroid isomerase-like protein
MRLVIAGLVLSALVSPARAADGGDVAAVKATVESFAAAFDKKDLAAVLALTAQDPDSVYIGTDAAEYWVGFAPLKDALERSFKALESQKTTLRDVRVKVLAGGKAAVATYLMDAEGKSGGEPFAIKGMRATSVLEKRKGKWVVVSSHGSVPVAGQAVKY